MDDAPEFDFGSNGGPDCRPDSDPARTALEDRWLHLTRTALPAVAVSRGWPVRFDHCFQRILLDHACGGCWYDRITYRPAYRNAPDDILRRAVAAGEAAFDGLVDMHALNAASLGARGKAPVDGRGQG